MWWVVHQQTAWKWWPRVPPSGQPWPGGPRGPAKPTQWFIATIVCPLKWAPIWKKSHTKKLNLSVAQLSMPTHQNESCLKFLGVFLHQTSCAKSKKISFAWAVWFLSFLFSGFWREISSVQFGYFKYPKYHLKSPERGLQLFWCCTLKSKNWAQESNLKFEKKKNLGPKGPNTGFWAISSEIWTWHCLWSHTCQFLVHCWKLVTLFERISAEA